MKDYKAEIENEIKESFADGCAFADGYDDKIKGTLKDRTNKLFSLFREIVKEAVKVEPSFAHKDIAPWTKDKAIAFDRGFKQARSEILSNVEKVIK